jgi:hypothetical protein
MSKRIRTHLRSNVVGYIALFCFAMSGTAAALPGTNTVDSGDIINGQVKTGDLGANAVSSAKIADAQVQTPDLAASAVGGDKVLDNGITGSDVAENTLGPVPSALTATLGGLGRGGTQQDTCDPAGTGFAACTSLALTLPATTRVLVLGRVGAFSENADLAGGKCRLEETVVGVVPDTQVTFKSGVNDVESATLIGVSPPLGPGPHTFVIACNQVFGSMDYNEASVSAVALSPS